MKSIDIGEFSLVAYDDGNEIHKKAAKLFESDEDFSEYVGEFWDLMDTVNYAKKIGRYSDIYLAYIGDKLVGMVGLLWILDLPELVVGILPEMRGNHYSSKLLKEYTKYVFDSYQDYCSIYAYIHSENIHSQENALSAGLNQLDEHLYIIKRY